MESISQIKLRIVQQTPASSPQLDTCKLQSQSPTKTEESRDHSTGSMPSTNHLVWTKTIFTPEEKGKKKKKRCVYIYAPMYLYVYDISFIRHLHQNTWDDTVIATCQGLWVNCRRGHSLQWAGGKLFPKAKESLLPCIASELTVHRGRLSREWAPLTRRGPESSCSCPRKTSS